METNLLACRQILDSRLHILDLRGLRPARLLAVILIQIVAPRNLRREPANAGRQRTGRVDCEVATSQT
jgi:hypothetical protein